ncbi:MAG: acetyl-CoA carboxylase biotin carboxylase subunit [Betaproteobacteria bacterium]
MPVTRVLVANRGEIALRVIRACQQMGLETVLAVSAADRDSLPARLADQVLCIGPAPAAQSYLQIPALIMAAMGSGADALHPGYGFLSESPELATACAEAGLVFVGPRADNIRDMGNKLRAREKAQAFGLPLLPGSEQVCSWQEALAVAEQIGFPVLLKAAAGGGGKGMKVVREGAQMQALFEAATGEAAASFGDNTLYLERYIDRARHIEVQVLGDDYGQVIHLGERDCSLQRRHQKLVEESPAPALSDALRGEICQAAVTLAKNIGYVSAGTVEFIYDEALGHFYFLEMNTRIQVEHPVTEMVTGIDLVQEQLRVARGEKLRFAQSDLVFRGHAIECRINAELPLEGFRPSPGRISQWSPPQGPNIRLDSHCHEGYLVPPYYDSLMAKLIVYGVNRQEAIERMVRALKQFQVQGPGTTIDFLGHVVAHPEFAQGRVTTGLVEQLIEEFALEQERLHAP